MPGFPVETLPGTARVTALLAKLTARIRKLETTAALAGPLLVVPATVPSTTSTTDVLLWTILPDQREDTTVAITLATTLSALAAAQLTLRDGNGQVIATCDVASGQPATLTTKAPAPGPYSLYGHTSAGTLHVALVSSTAPRWVAT